MPEVKRADGGTEQVSEEDLEAAAEFYDKLCKYCGTKKLETSMYCPNCGNVVE